MCSRPAATNTQRPNRFADSPCDGQGGDFIYDEVRSAKLLAEPQSQSQQHAQHQVPCGFVAAPGREEICPTPPHCRWRAQLDRKGSLNERHTTKPVSLLLLLLLEGSREKNLSQNAADRFGHCLYGGWDARISLVG